MKQLPEPFSTLFDRTAQATLLPPDERYAWEAGHTWSDDERKAVVHAWASGRPLLVRGEAGSGKSQVARALAKVLGVQLITEVIHPRFEATDLMYRDDHVERLAHAQVLSVAAKAGQSVDDMKTWLNEELAPKRFIKRGPLWKAMDEQAPIATDAPVTTLPKEWPRAVLLIDEIDKTDADVPNALLDVLGNRSLALPATGEVVAFSSEHAPLIIITTNEDRELPAAFVRRCAVLNLGPDDSSEAAFVSWLSQRAMAHALLAPWGEAPQSPLYGAAKQVWADRQAAKDAGLPTVGLAEYLDLLYSLLRLAQGRAELALELLDEIAPYALVKHREQKQNRAPVKRRAQGDGA